MRNFRHHPAQAVPTGLAPGLQFPIFEGHVPGPRNQSRRSFGSRNAATHRPFRGLDRAQSVSFFFRRRTTAGARGRSSNLAGFR